MASTRLVRKARRNRVVSRQRVNTIKRLTSKPVIKKVDVKQIKEEFANQKTKPVAKKEEPVKETPMVEPKAEKKEVAPKDTGKKTEKKPRTKAATSAEAKEEKKPRKAPAKKSEPKKEQAPKAEKKEDKAE